MWSHAVMNLFLPIKCVFFSLGKQSLPSQWSAKHIKVWGEDCSCIFFLQYSVFVIYLIIIRFYGLDLKLKMSLRHHHIWFMLFGPSDAKLCDTVKQRNNERLFYHCLNCVLKFVDQLENFIPKSRGKRGISSPFI